MFLYKSAQREEKERDRGDPKNERARKRLKTKGRESGMFGEERGAEVRVGTSLWGALGVDQVARDVW